MRRPRPAGAGNASRRAVSGVGRSGGTTIGSAIGGGRSTSGTSASDTFSTNEASLFAGTTTCTGTLRARARRNVALLAVTSYVPGWSL